MLYRPQKGSKALKIVEQDDDDVLVFSQPEVDFAPLLAQVFAIESPLTVLCREDCRGLSLDELSRLAGVSKSMLSQIERAESSASVAALARPIAGCPLKRNREVGGSTTPREISACLAATQASTWWARSAPGRCSWSTSRSATAKATS